MLELASRPPPPVRTRNSGASPVRPTTGGGPLDARRPRPYLAGQDPMQEPGIPSAEWPRFTRAISTHDVIRMLQHEGRPTALGEAIAHYGRIFKTLYLLSFLDRYYRRELKRVRNHDEGRHDLARDVLPRSPRRAAPALPSGSGRPARRARTRAQLHHPVEYGLSQRCAGTPARYRLSHRPVRL